MTCYSINVSHVTMISTQLMMMKYHSLELLCLQLPSLDVTTTTTTMTYTAMLINYHITCKVTNTKLSTQQA